MKDVRDKMRACALAMAMVSGSACDDAAERAATTADPSRGEWTPTGKSDELATCVGACGGEADAGCWCDADCEQYGDCCPDVEDICAESESGEDGVDTDDGSGPPGDCQAQLAALGAEFTATEHETESPAGFPDLECEIQDAVLLHGPINGVGLRYFENDSDTPVLLSCAAALSVVASAAVAQTLGADEMIHMGTYNCRVIAGTSKLSQHANGEAIDIFGFTLQDGSEITVLDDWEGSEDGQRLHDFTDQLWADEQWNVILTPDFNAAHSNHVHLDRTPGGHTYQ